MTPDCDGRNHEHKTGNLSEVQLGAYVVIHGIRKHMISNETTMRKKDRQWQSQSISQSLIAQNGKAIPSAAGIDHR